MSTTVLLACVLGLETADLATVGATAAPLQRAMQISHTELGLVASVSLAVGALGCLPAGSLVDRLDRVRLLVLSIVLWSGAVVLIGAATSLIMLICSRILLGLLSAAAWPAVASLVGDLFDPGERGRIWAYILSGELVGTGFGYLVGGNLAASTSWRVPFWLLAAPALAIAIALHVALPEPRRRDHASHESDDGRLPLRTAVRRVLAVRTNVILIASSVLGYFFFAGERTFGAEYLHGRFGLGNGLASTVLVLIGSGSLVGVFVGGRAADRLRASGHRGARIAVAAMSYVLAALLLIPGLLAASLLFAAPLLFLAAAALEASKAPSDAARLDIMQPRLWGRAEGVRTVLRTLAQAVAPITFGLIADSFGVGGGRVSVTAHHAQGLEIALLIMLVPLFAAGVLLWFGRGIYRHDMRGATRHRSDQRRPVRDVMSKAPSTPRLSTARPRSRG